MIKSFIKTILLVAVVSGSFGVYAQVSFTDVAGTPFTGVNSPCVQFVDINNDTYLDVFIAGYDGSTRVSNFYTNDGTGKFTLLGGTSITGVNNAACDFADLDGNGFQDLILTGWDGSMRIAEYYKNSGGGVFTLTAAPFKAVNKGRVEIRDMNGDTHLDVVIMGYNTAASARIAEIYTNDGSGNFTLFGTPPAFLALNDGSMDFVNIDPLVDAHVDVLVTGDDGPAQDVGLFRGNGAGVFAAAAHPFTKARKSDADFADINGDTYPDVFLTGYDGSTRTAEMFTNDGSGNFSAISIGPIEAVNSCAVEFFDANNDGNVDLWVTGFRDTVPNRITKFYTNDGTGSFTYESGLTLLGMSACDMDYGDIDGDGDLDVIIAGYTDAGTRVTKLYRNDFVLFPVELVDFTASVVDQREVRLDWQTASEENNAYFTIEKSRDNDTWTKVSEVPGARDSQELIEYTSLDKFPFAGTSYYRLKQTDLDGKFVYSQVRTVTLNANMRAELTIYPNPNNGSFVAELDHPVEEALLEILDLTGRRIVQIPVSHSRIEIDQSSLPEGVYFIRVLIDNNVLSTDKFIITR